MSEIYQDGTYLQCNPTWHQEDSAWKAERILAIVERNAIHPGSICEIGCGAGGILGELARRADENVRLMGYEISPQAYELCVARKGPNLDFRLGNLLEQPEAWFDLVLAIDVLEHVEDCYSFLRALRLRGRHKLFHIPLDLSVNTVFRKGWLPDARKRVGHIQSFTRETALALLEETGYQIMDTAYTSITLDRPGPTWKSRTARHFRRVLYRISPSFTARVLGGCSLLVLAK